MVRHGQRQSLSGVVNKKTADASVIKDLDFVPYEVIEPSLKPSEQILFLEELWTEKLNPYGDNGYNIQPKSAT